MGTPFEIARALNQLSSCHGASDKFRSSMSYACQEFSNGETVYETIMVLQTVTFFWSLI